MTTTTASSIPKGTTSKYCTCPAPCPKLRRSDGRWSARHGKWRYQIELPPAPGQPRRNPLRRRGFDTETAAATEMDIVRQLLSIGADDGAARAEIADYLISEIKTRKRLPDPDEVRRKVRARVDLSKVYTVAEWLDEFMRRSRLCATTLRTYEAHIRLYLAPHLGHLRLDDLKVRHIADMFDAIDEFNEYLEQARTSKDPQVRATVKWRRPVRLSTKHRIRATLRAAINVAIKQDRLLEFNAAAAYHLPTATAPRALEWTPERIETWRNAYDRAKETARPYPSRNTISTLGVYLSVPRPSPVMVWNPEHVAVFLNHAQTHYLYPLYRLIALRGLRRGEAAGLRWSDTRLDQQLITVCWQITQLGWDPIAKPPKSDAGNRDVALDTDTTTVLKAHRIDQGNQRLDNPGWHDTDYIFTREDGQPFHPQIISDTFYRLCLTAGLPPIRLHDLRHCAASLMYATGADLKEIQDTLGHSTLTLTSDTYTTLFTQASKKTAQATANLLNDYSRAKPLLN